MRILLIDGQDRSLYYRSLRAAMDAEWCVRSSTSPLTSMDVDCDIALVSDEFGDTLALAVRQLAQANIPTLHVVDGIVEWRNNWANPRSLSANAGMPLFQPILSHKVACLGRSQARIFESWGNIGKCEVVGGPRFDGLLQRKPRERAAGEPATVLILTAKTPGFTPEQMNRTRQSLFDLNAWFEQRAAQGDLSVRPRWRITGGLDEELGISNELRDTTGEDLANALNQVDAVITTPSTSMLEAMLQGVPVALLDYHNCPHYVPAAWTIGARAHLEMVMPELVSPPAAKMLYQDTVLHDALECHTPATSRLVQLITDMARIGQECRSRGLPLTFPDRILKDEQADHHLPEIRFDLQKMYPDHPLFGNMDRVALQVELGHALLKVNQLEQQLEQVRLNKLQLGQTLQHQLETCEASLSFRLGRALTWPLRTIAGALR